MDHDDPFWHSETQAIRAGREHSGFGEHSQSLYLTSSFTFESAAAGAALFLGEQSGYTYSRFTNPTVSAFQSRLAALEGGERAIATASGMAAIQAVMMSYLQAGDHLLASQSLFGSTLNLFSKTLSRFAVETSFVAPTDLDAWRAAIRPNTRILFVETPSNPLTEVADIAQLAELAHGPDR